MSVSAITAVLTGWLSCRPPEALSEHGYQEIPTNELTSQDKGMQADLLHLSSASHHVIADQSGHSVQLDQPAAAVGAIVQMGERLRR